MPTRRKRVFLEGAVAETEYADVIRGDKDKEDKEGIEDKDAMLGMAGVNPGSFNSFSRASKFKKVESIYNPVAPSL